jgi:hypothetical protein
MLSPEERDEVCGMIEMLRGELDDLALRGLRAAGPDDLRTLDSLKDECGRIGAAHLAERTTALVDAIRGSDAGAGAALMRAQTSLRVFERVMTLDTVADALELAATLPVEEEPSEEEEPEAKPETVKKAPLLKVIAGGAPVKPPPPPLTLEEGKKIVPTLDDLSRTVEDLVATGLTTASDATRQKLDVTMKEALRLKLSRLGASLRFVNEETGRFLSQDAGFSPRRFAFFLNRSWILARGLSRAIKANDAAAFSRLLLSPATTPVKKLEVASLGASKRIVKSTSSCAFEFRLRVLADAPPLVAGQRLVWSCLFSYTSSFPAEAFLHLPQPQKFLPRLFCDPNRIVIEKAAVALDDSGGGRLVLGPESTVTAKNDDVPWDRYLDFDPAGAAARLRAHKPGPLDIEVELQEEVVLKTWTVGKPAERPGRPDQLVYPLKSPAMDFDAVVSTGDDGKELREKLDAFRPAKAARPPLFGLVHYELCRPIFQPLAVIDKEGPGHLMISGNQEFDPKTLADLTRAIMNKR